MAVGGHPDEIRTLVPIVPDGELDVFEYDHETAEFCHWRLTKDGRMIPIVQDAAPSS